MLSDVLDIGMHLNAVRGRVAKEQLGELSLRQSSDPAPASGWPKPDTDHRTSRSRVRPPVIPMPGDIAGHGVVVNHGQSTGVIKDRARHFRA